MVSQARHFQAYEGDSFSILRSDGTIETNRYDAAEVRFEIPRKDLATLSPQEVMRRMDEAALQMAEKVSKQAYEKLTEFATKAGTIVDAAGTPLSVDLVFEVLEKIELDFYEEDESPHELTMVAGPELGQALQELILEWPSDPEVERRKPEGAFRHFPLKRDSTLIWQKAVVFASGEKRFRSHALPSLGVAEKG